ncbi:MAG: response regulator transcription factor [Bacteroidaceae bacterium]|nr:response regulator transcription factor [Bacteroidaceae bacterium]
MKYLIIEDEPLAYEELKRLVGEVRPDYQLAGWANSVQTAAEMLRVGQYDLLFMDIRLSDGLCFDIFRIVPTRIPVIFTTAYDEYALRAFKANSVDYLLKPIDEDDLQEALAKFEANHLPDLQSRAVREAEGAYMQHFHRMRFLVTVGDEYRYVDVADIRCFMSEEKYTVLYVRGGRQYVISHTLDSIEHQLDRHLFCRISRNCIAHIHAVVRCSRFFAGRLNIQLDADCPQEPVVVSRSRAAQVLAWMDGRVGEDDR